ncbi:glycosyl hydrolase 115 family protein [candidate division KSB1 bacterium]|nr:glycosyl hydrolase 115 family protein [candidate division KSB1 bacterium]
MKSTIVSIQARKMSRIIPSFFVQCLMCLVVIIGGYQSVYALSNTSYISTVDAAGRFPLFVNGQSAPLVASSDDYAGVAKIMEYFQADIERVTNTAPHIYMNDIPAVKHIVLIGTLGKSPMIDDLVQAKKIDESIITGKWETFIIQSIDNPYPDVEKALVIVGSDKRGTIFGMFDVSREIGVSPWYWWADAPVQKKQAIYVNAGVHTKGTPKVKYRGIFINDEAPALTGWVAENYGLFNHQFYEKVYELILRLHGNYLWPAMWGRSLFDDDSLSAPLANELGVVIGTSHHEPLMRSHVEWERYGKGEWNYEKNPEELRKFWRKGIERMDGNESIVTIGMRGDGDEAMTQGTAIELLERIVKDQRKIIAEVTGKPASETPQDWALYKEVQDYYDKGMRVPDDVMLLLCDDNWGNVRVLPKKADRDRKGGFGIYYHFDFVGGPVSYKWLNVTQIEKVWEQMNLSYQWGARELWLVNVGDLKPMELPISFFIDFGWDPESFTADKLPEYYTLWAKQQFGEAHADEIGYILSLYTKYNARRTPEMLKPDTYSLFNYREAESVVNDYNALVEKSKQIYDGLPAETKAAFYQLVLFPVEICANLNEMYVTVAKNRLYKQQERASTNNYAKEAKALFENDKTLTDYYHHKLLNGKWNHIMSQTHIGYTSWNEPPQNIMPEVAEYSPYEDARPGIMVEGSLAEGESTLPEFDSINNQNYYIEIFNKGLKPLSYQMEPDEGWIKLSSASGNVPYEERIFVSIDWNKAPKGKHEGIVNISAAGEHFSIKVPIHKISIKANGFIENNRVISINAANYCQAINADDMNWLTVPNMGRTNSAVTIYPSNVNSRQPGNDSPNLQYEFTIFEPGELNVQVYSSPTLNFPKGEGLKFAVSMDEDDPRIINMHEGETTPDWTYPQWWNQSVTDHIKIKSSKHSVNKPGIHTLKIWMVDPGIVFQKIVIDAGGLKPSYLGPPESLRLDN